MCHDHMLSDMVEGQLDYSISDCTPKRRKILEQIQQRSRNIMNHCLDTLIDMIEKPVRHPDEILEILKDTIERYDGKGYKIEQRYKDKYKELKNGKS